MKAGVGSLALGVAVAACIAPPPQTAPSPSKPASDSSTPSRVAMTEPPPRPAVHCRWPNDAKAAVSLTYDDALPSQLKYAVPVLAQYQLKATFFLSGGRIADFAAQAQAGHELGSHTVTHPCNADLARLSLEEMALELDAGRAAVGGERKLSFAYPCGQSHVAGGASYVPLVKARFSAARAVGAAVADPGAVDPFNVPALFPPSSSDGSDVIAFFEGAVRAGGWAVIGFHGISEQGEYLQLSQAAHDRIARHLAEHRAEIWTAPFGEVARTVADCQSASGK
jgi:peptidoglycan/xylan/chitin deacetylase (PgdA/CDA1 family)